MRKEVLISMLLLAMILFSFIFTLLNTVPTAWQHLNAIKQKGYFNKVCPTCGQEKKFN